MPCKEIALENYFVRSCVRSPVGARFSNTINRSGHDGTEIMPCLRLRRRFAATKQDVTDGPPCSATALVSNSRRGSSAAASASPPSRSVQG